MPPAGRNGGRIVAPAITLANILPFAAAIGVTRLADVTGLDRIGVPVFQAVRPQAKSLSVSQGKGITPDAARISALMEAIELHCAEEVPASSRGVATQAEAALWRRVPAAFHQDAPFDPACLRSWVTGRDMSGGRPVRVPLGLVSMDCTIARAADLWPNTNGLAAGNDRIEAEVAGLCEVIERDAQARWMAATPAARRATAIDPATIGDRAGRWLLARVARSGLRCALWDMSAAHGVAVIGCAIIDPGTVASLALPPAFGAGCHPSAPVALVRAITEAAQTRAALIAGARDDLSPADYADPGGQRSALLYATRDFGGRAPRDWSQVPDRIAEAPEVTRDWLLRLCGAAGGPILSVDLGPDEAPFAVVRIIVPGFGDHDRPSSLPPL